MRRLLADLSPLEWRTFRLHLAASVLDGVAFGLFLVHDFFAIKTLGAAPWQVWVLVSLWPVANLLSIYFAGKLEERQRLAGLLLVAGFAGRLPIALMAFSSSVYVLLALQGLFASSFALAKPAQNVILQANYREGKRGELFGWTSGVFVACGGAASIAAGLLLDRDPQFYRLLFPIEAVAGLGYFLLLAAIPLAPNMTPPACQERQGLLGAAVRTVRVLREDRGYLRFERNFMVYGAAFMVILPAIPVLADRIQLTYTQFTLARGILGQILALLVMPWFGRRLDRARPARISAVVFGILAFFPALVGLSPLLGLPSSAFWFCSGYFIYGIAMGGLHLVWHIGSIHYAPPGMVATYQGIHVTLTGVRGLVAPLAGYLILRFVGVSLPFAISSLLFLTAARLMARQARDEEEVPAPGSPPCPCPTGESPPGG